MLNPPELFAVRNEFVLRLFLLSVLDAEDAKALLRPLVANSAKEMETLRQNMAAADGALPPGELPFGRLVAEYGLRSFQTLHDWALWALNRIDQSQSG